MVVYKYKIPLVDTGASTISMPSGAHILNTNFQGEDLMVWALVDLEKPAVKRIFRVAATGEALGPQFKGVYVGTAKLYNHPFTFVWHVFDLGE